MTQREIIRSDDLYIGAVLKSLKRTYSLEELYKNILNSRKLFQYKFDDEKI